MNKLKANTLYILDVKGPLAEYEEYYEMLLGVTKHNRRVLCLGEITNMKGHYIFVRDDGGVVYGLHPDIFRLPKDEEL